MFALIPLCPCIMVFPLFRQMLSVHFCGGEGVGGVRQLLEPAGIMGIGIEALL